MKRLILISAFLLCTNVFVCAGAVPLEANPFFEKKVEPAPVITGGTGFIKQQLEFRKKVAVLLRGMRDEIKPVSVFLVALFSFLYGLFHALGPGHRKSVLFSLFLASKRKWYEPIWGGLISASVHALSSIILISMLWFIGSRMHLLARSENAYSVMEVGTFTALALVSIILIIMRISSLVKRSHGESGRGKVKSVYAVILLSSLVPCPGASMLLLLALYSELALAGIIGVISMSAGMAVVTASAAALGWAGREGLFMGFRRHERLIYRLSASVEIFSYSLILVLSLAMCMPFLSSVLLK